MKLFSVPSELAILKKERFNNWYKLKTYYAAFLVADVPMQVRNSREQIDLDGNVAFMIVKPFQVNKKFPQTH